MDSYPDLSPRLWPPTEEQLAFWQDQAGHCQRLAEDVS